MTYAAAVALIRKGRNGRKKLANNTYLEFTGSYHGLRPLIGVKVHKTFVIVIQSDDSLILNSGGYKTRLTLDRINTYLPTGYRLYQERHTWKIWHNNTTVNYQDGMMIVPGNVPVLPDTNGYTEGCATNSPDQWYCTHHRNGYHEAWAYVEWPRLPPVVTNAVLRERWPIEGETQVAPETVGECPFCHVTHPGGFVCIDEYTVS